MDLEERPSEVDEEGAEKEEFLPKMVNPEVIVTSDQVPVASNEVETVTITDTDEASSSSNLSIPTFSYASVSPVCSPPEFSHISGLDFENRKDPEEEDGKEEPQASSSSSSKKSAVHKIIHASPTKIQSTFPDIVPEDRRSSFLSQEKSPEVARKAPQSFLESGGFLQPPALGCFPLPRPGQSLTSFLSSLSCDSMPELDRENAHFNVSEAIISAFERLKVDRVGKKKPTRRSPDIPPDEMEDVFGTVKQSKSHARHGPLVEPDATRKFYSGKRFPRPPILYTETEESELV